MKRLLLAVVVSVAVACSSSTTTEGESKLDIEIEDCGALGSEGTTALVTNRNDETWDVYVEVGYVKGDALVDTDNADLTIPPGKSALVEGLGSGEAYDDCRVVELSGFVNRQ